LNRPQGQLTQNLTMRIRLVSLVVLAALSICARADTVAARWHDEVAAPRLDALKQTSSRLRAAADDLCVRMNQDKLNTMRDAWVATFAAWRALDPLPLDDGLRKAIEPGPAELQQVEDGVRAFTAATTVAPDAPTGARGLQALEYLLWGNDRAAVQLGRLAFHQRCLYVQALGDAVPAQVDTLIAGAQDASANSRVDYLERIAASAKVLAGPRLAKLGDGNWQPSPSDFDGWRSKQTKRAVAAEIGTMEELLLGPGGTAAYLAPLFMGDAGSALQARLRDDFDTIHATLAKLPDDLPDSLTRHPANAAPLVTKLQDVAAVAEQLRQAALNPINTPAGAASQSPRGAGN
jgi:predicted lipoprotein